MEDVTGYHNRYGYFYRARHPDKGGFEETSGGHKLWKGWAMQIKPMYNAEIIKQYKDGNWKFDCDGHPPCYTVLYVYRDPVMASVASGSDMMWCDDNTQARLGPKLQGPLEQDRHAIRVGGRLPTKDEVLRWGEELEGQLINLVGGAPYLFVASPESGGYDGVSSRGTAEPLQSQLWSGVVAVLKNPFAQMHYEAGSCYSDLNAGVVEQCHGLDEMAPPVVICGIPEPAGLACGNRGEVAIVDTLTQIDTPEEAEEAAAKTGGRLPTVLEAYAFYESVYVPAPDFFVLNPDLAGSTDMFHGKPFLQVHGPVGYRDLMYSAPGRGPPGPHLWSSFVFESGGKEAQMDGRHCNGHENFTCASMKNYWPSWLDKVNPRLDQGPKKTLVYCAIPCGDKAHAMVVRYKTGRIAIATGAKVALEMARKNSPAPQAGRLPFLSEVRLWPADAIKILKANSFALPPFDGQVPVSSVMKQKLKYTRICVEVKGEGADAHDKLEVGLYYAVKGSLWNEQPWFVTTDVHEKHMDSHGQPAFRSLRKVKHYLGLPEAWVFNVGINPRGTGGTCYSSQVSDLNEFLRGQYDSGQVGSGKAFIFFCAGIPKPYAFQYVHPSRCGANVGPHFFVLSDAQYGRSDYIAQDKHGGFLYPGSAGFDAVSEKQLGGGFTSVIDGADPGKDGKVLLGTETKAPNPTDLGRPLSRQMQKVLSWVGSVKQHDHSLQQTEWEPKCVSAFAQTLKNNCFSLDDLKAEVIACRPNVDVRAPPSSKVGHKGPPLPKLNICGWHCRQGRTIPTWLKENSERVWQKLKHYTSMQDLFLDKRGTGRFSEVAVTYNHATKKYAAWSALNPPVDLYRTGADMRTNQVAWTNLTVSGTEDHEVCVKPTFVTLSGYRVDSSLTGPLYDNLAEAVRPCGELWAHSKSCGFIRYSVETKKFQRYAGGVVVDSEGYLVITGDDVFQKKGENTVLYAMGPHGIRMRPGKSAEQTKDVSFLPEDLISDFTAPAPYGASESCAVLKAYHATDLATGKWTFEGSQRFAASLGGRLPTVDELRQFDTFAHPVYQTRKEYIAGIGTSVWVPASNKRANPSANGGLGEKDWVRVGQETMSSRDLFSFRERMECPMERGNTATAINVGLFVGPCTYTDSPQVGYCPDSLPLDDPFSKRPWWIPKNQPLHGPLYCPQPCQQCKNGKVEDGGTNIVNNLCMDFCSMGSFCGTSEGFKQVGC